MEDEEGEDDDDEEGEEEEEEGESGSESENEIPYSPPPLILPHEDPTLDHNQKVFNARNVFVQRSEVEISGYSSITLLRQSKQLVNNSLFTWRNKESWKQYMRIQ